MGLAFIEIAIALSQKEDLIIYIEGRTMNFGGIINVRHSSTNSLPPTYIIEELPGNTGPFPLPPPTVPAFPSPILTKKAFIFPGGAVQGGIKIEHSKGGEQIQVTEVK